MTDTLQALRESPERARFNLWRRETPGALGWPRSARPGAPAKYFMFSADTHVVEPADYLKDIEPEYRERIPHLETRDDGSQWLITEGNRPQRVRAAQGARTRPARSGPRAPAPRSARSTTRTCCATRRAAPSSSASPIMPPTASTPS